MASRNVIVCLLVLPELVIWILSFSGWDVLYLRAKLYQNFAFWPELLGNWRPNYSQQPYLMFLSYSFLHAGIGHLLINVIVLWQLGRRVVEDGGPRLFLWIYLAGIIGGALGYWLLNTRPFPMVGASGALFGLAGGILVWRLRHETMDLILDVLWPLGYLAGVNVIIFWALGGRLAWEAHLGGFVFGGLAMLILSTLPPHHACKTR